MTSPNYITNSKTEETDSEYTWEWVSDGEEDTCSDTDWLNSSEEEDNALGAQEKKPKPWLPETKSLAESQTELPSSSSISESPHGKKRSKMV